MITKSVFKALLKAKSASIGLDKTSIHDHQCTVQDNSLTVIDPHDCVVFRTKLDNPDKAWASLQSFLSQQHKKSKEYEDAQKKKLVKMTERYAKRFLKLVKGITLRNCENAEYQDAIEYLTICKYVIENNINEAYTHMNGLNTGCRDNIPGDLFDLLNEVGDYVQYE